MRKPTRHRPTVLACVVASGLLLTACADDGGSTSAAGDGTCSPDEITLIGQVRNQTNPYEAAWLTGGDTFAESVGLEQQHLTYDGDSQRQQEQIRQALAGSGMECAVLNVLPNGDSDTAPIVAAANEAGAFLVTQWNKPAELNPWDGFDRWVAHITYDGEESGYLIAKALFDRMGGSGGVIALQGILDTSAAQDRFAGLQRALSEYPGITLLDEQTAGFDRAEALNVTRTLLTAHADHVGGIWAANDDMALGALQALEAAGLENVGVVGIDAVPEAIAAIQEGRMTATVSSDGPWQGAIGLAMGYCAATGELDPASVDNDDRAFFAEQFLIDQSNVAEFAAPELDMADFDCANVFERATGPIG
ncbi:sugar ABC transporter substrate-binding protein [Jiangella aurantiaca]|uniref:Sugar ABC transporter substrate-binding protein n=1 Tax=Jiangella aurantiaca TaxID=2530373 RepID=A0A4R5A1C8_9ACTN|nr:sugar ABC transporter substrate-binding protein [Jiangella aurantiaca]TDD64556.1 sugar ABC transporter substrate-binding protein [Jiangella aurantiaca]